MRTRNAALLAVVAVLSSGAPARAEAGAAGVTCSFMSLPQVDDGDWQFAEIDGGPLVLTDPADSDGVVWGSLTCTLQREGTHAGADLASVTGSTAPGVVSAAGTVAYESTPDDTLYLCTQVNVAGGATLYHDGVTEEWSTSDTVPCLSSVGPGDPDPTPGNLLTELAALVDEVVCPVLEVLFPPQGDVAGIWDCPPYQT